MSTEVDARLSFDTAGDDREGAPDHRAVRGHGIDRVRVLIKIASTWEGIRAVEMLEREGIHCNMTLMFGMAQAIQAAESGATLISPFVGRITDWFKKAEGKDGYAPDEDPGVLFVRGVYAAFKKLGYHTQIMGASFRSVDQVLGLAGCDLLTVSPDLLQKLDRQRGTVEQHLDAETREAAEHFEAKIYDEPKFRFDDERRRDGDREAGRRHPHLRVRRDQAREADRRDAVSRGGRARGGVAIPCG